MEYLRRIKLRNKIFLLCAMLVFLTTVLIQSSTWWISSKFNESQLQQDVLKAKAIMSQYLDAKAEMLVTAAKILTSDFGYIRAVATSDEKTIRSVLENHGERIGADIMLLTDMSGQYISSSSENFSFENQLSPYAAQQLINNPASALFVTLEEQIYQLILLPVKAPHVIAYSIVGFKIDEEVLTELKTLTGLEISFFQGDNHLLSSTIRMKSFADFRQELNNQSYSKLLFSRPAFFTEDFELDSASKQPVSVILVSSLVPLYQQYDSILLNNTILAVVVSLLASLLSIFFAKSLTVPLQRLSGLAGEYARGRYTERINITGGQEIESLEKAFQQMGQQVKKREDEIRFQANHDSLTKLPNSQHVKTLLSTQLASEGEYIFLAISINNFRQINDRLGPETADACLVALAERLREMNSGIQFSARLEGAEFFSAISFDASHSPIQVADSYLTELEHTFKVADLNINLDLHAGVSLYRHSGTDPITILRRTAIALDAARKNKQRIHCYEEGEDEVHMQRLAMMEALRKVIMSDGAGQLFMVYQPKIYLQGEHQFKSEALIRWRREDDRFVSPEVFVNLAEEASLIVDLTHWVIRSVFHQLREWQQQEVYVGAAINVSAQDLAHPDFESFIRDSCEEYGVTPSTITLEITERDIMHDEASVVLSLRSLKKFGFTIAIDDYGIGQSSLSKLKGLPVDEIKLDKSFIMHLNQSPKDQLIVRSTIDMAHGLGFEVVAEGVENEETLALLKQFNCDQVQGYFISKPIPAEAVSDWQKNYVENDYFTLRSPHARGSQRR